MEYFLYNVEKAIVVNSTKKEVFPMSILQQVPDKMQTIFQTLPDEAAVGVGLVERKRKLTGSALTQILVLGWLENPEASYQYLTETAASLGIQGSRQALEQRLTAETAEMLKLTLEGAVTEMLEVSHPRQVPALLEEFSGVFVQDSTYIRLPDELHETWKGSPKKNHPQKTGLKLHLCFDVLTGGFQHFHLTDAVTADSTAMKTASPLPQGSLRLADLAYFSLDEFEKLTENGIYWISRLKANSYLSDETGARLDLENMLKAEENTFSRKRIRIGKTKQLQGYLIAQRLSEAETNKRRCSIRHRAKRKAQTPSKTLLRLAGWNLYMTNIEPHRLTPKQICAIVGIRWQIQLIFKCFKSLSKMHVSRIQKPYRILSEIYAKLIAVLIQNAVMLATGYRHIQHSFFKAARYIIGFAREIAASFHHSKNQLRNTLKTIKQTFEKGGTFQRTLGKNTTFRKLKEATENP
ncbi:IS4 family transposase [Candidatus Poribacteria bacterium]|nr:IS4 family transposase [Candidatus Poribacteria bacterium]